MDNRKRDLEEFYGVLNAIENRLIEEDMQSDYFIKYFPLKESSIGGRRVFLAQGYLVAFILSVDLFLQKTCFKIEGDTTEMIEKIKSIISEKEKELIGEVIQTNSESSKRKRL